MRTLALHCTTCGMERPFEQPPCQDGHGLDCDEWVCVACGEATLLASFTVTSGGQRARTATAGGGTRRARAA